jgi:hypothetical protein
MMHRSLPIVAYADATRSRYLSVDDLVGRFLLGHLSGESSINLANWFVMRARFERNGPAERRQAVRVAENSGGEDVAPRIDTR